MLAGLAVPHLLLVGLLEYWLCVVLLLGSADDLLPFDFVLLLALPDFDVLDGDIIVGDAGPAVAERHPLFVPMGALLPALGLPDGVALVLLVGDVGVVLHGLDQTLHLVVLVLVQGQLLALGLQCRS